MRTTMWLCVCACALLAMASAVQGQETQWLQYRSSADASRLDAWSSSRELEALSERPPGVELPEFKCDRPLFAQWKTEMVPAGFLWLAMDKAKGKGSYDLLYLDSDCDGSLADETAIAPHRTDQYRRQFGPVKIVFPGEDGPITYHLNVTRYTYSGDRAGIRAAAGGWYEGRVTLEGKSLRFLLLDFNSNGAFNDLSLHFSDMDAFRLQSGDDLLVRAVGKYMSHAGKLYRMEIPRDGGSVRFVLAPGLPMGQVRTPPGTGHVAFLGPMYHHRTDPDENDLCQLAAGTYTVEYWNIERKDAMGKVWTMSARESENARPIEVKAGETVDLSIGDGTRADLETTKSGKSYTFKLKLVGTLGDNVRIAPKDGQSSPRLTITSADGKYSRPQVFTYG